MAGASDLLHALMALLARVMAALRAFSARGKSILLFGEYERVEEAKYYPPAPPPASLLEDAELPSSYGTTEVKALIVNPHLVHVYWDVGPRTLASVRTREDAPAFLRFHDTDDGSWFDVEIDIHARRSYVDLWTPDRSYSIDLGVSTPDGGFAELARSNVFRTPRAWPAGEEEAPHGVASEIVWQESGSPEGLAVADPYLSKLVTAIAHFPPPEPATAAAPARMRYADLNRESIRQGAGPGSAKAPHRAVSGSGPKRSSRLGKASLPARADLTAIADREFSAGVTSSRRAQNPKTPAG